MRSTRSFVPGMMESLVFVAEEFKQQLMGLALMAGMLATIDPPAARAISASMKITCIVNWLPAIGMELAGLSITESV